MKSFLQKYNPFRNKIGAILAISVWITVANLFILLAPKIWSIITSIKHHVLYIGIYFLLLISVGVFQVFVKNRITERIFMIIGLPIGILWSILLLIQPILGLQASIFIYLIISYAFPFFFFKITQSLHITHFTDDKVFGLTLLTSTLIAVIFPNLLKRLVYSLPPLGSYNPKKKDKIKLKETIDYALTPPIIRLFIYVMYVVITIVLFIYSNENVYNNAIFFSFGLFGLIDFILSEFFKYNKTLDFQFTELFHKMYRAVSASIPKGV